jgi:hypothetical protein
MTIEIRPDVGDARIAYQQDHQKTLVAPPDDMWAAFAAMAEPYAVVVDGEVAGCCSVNEERELHHFYLDPEVEDRGESIFAYLVERLDLVSAISSTVDPSFLSFALDNAHRSVPVALVYQHVLEPHGPALTNLRVATDADHADAVAFAKSAIGAPEGLPGGAHRAGRTPLGRRGRFHPSDRRVSCGSDSHGLRAPRPHRRQRCPRPRRRQPTHERACRRLQAAGPTAPLLDGAHQPSGAPPDP